MSDEMSKYVLAENLRFYMSEKGCDRRELCDALGLKYSTVSEWLQGKKYPRIDKIELLANFFGIKKSDLIEPERQEKSDVSEEDIKFALFNGNDGITDEMFEEVKQFAEMVKMREQLKDKNSE